jgi:hypothetical protein
VPNPDISDKGMSSNTCSYLGASLLLLRLRQCFTGELTGYIGVTEAKLPKEFHLSNVVTFPKKSA